MREGRSTTPPVPYRLRRSVCMVSALACVGGAAASSPVIDIWYGSSQNFGHIGNPQQWVNVLGKVSDPDGVTALSFTLNGGPSQTLSLGPDTRRLADPGDFNVEIDHANLLDGANLVVITATDSLGNQSVENVTVNYTANQVWPLGYTTDWSLATDISEQAQVVDGQWALVANGVRTTALGYDRTFVVGDLQWTDYEILVPITVHALDPIDPIENPVSTGQGVGFVNRWVGHSTLVSGEQPHAYWLPAGATAWYAFEEDAYQLSAGNGISERDYSGPIMQLGQRYYWKLRSETFPSGETYHGMKVWRDIDPEPANWRLTGVNQPGDSLLGAGGVVFVAHHVDATFEDIQITDLALDTVAPGVANVQFTQFASGVLVEWTTDEATTGLVEYGLDTTYSLGSVASVGVGTSHSVFLPGLTAGQQIHYRVVSSDARGNTTTGADQVFTFNPPPDPSQIVSDDFSAPSLNAGLWTFVDPLGDSTVSVNGTQATISIPATAQGRDFWGGPTNDTPRLMQSAADTNFEVEVKFESPLTQDSQIQGIMVEQDVLNVLRVEFMYLGSSTRLFVGKVFGGTGTPVINQSMPLSTPMYLRLRRVGDDWTVLHSADGSAWTTATTFTQAMTVSRVGLYGANSGGTPHDMVADYFFNAVSPIIPEDGGATDGIPPSTPGSLSAPLVTGNQVDLTWDPSSDTGGSGLAGYRVFRDDVELGVVATNSFSDTTAQPETTYIYAVEAYDNAGNVSPRPTLQVVTPAAPPGAIVSDDFSTGSLDTGLWTFVDPLGDSTVQMTNASARIVIPANALGRDFWTGPSNDMPRLLQPAADTDFEVEAKFESPVDQDYQIQGITVEQDSLNILRIEFLYIAGATRIFVATINGGVGDTKTFQTASLGQPMFMRVNRSADQWTVDYSLDGATWQTAVSFNHAMTVTAVGLYGANGPGVAHTVEVDYFFNTASPIVPEDEGVDDEAPQVPPNLQEVSATVTQVEIDWDVSSDAGGSGVAGYRVYRDGVEIGDVGSTGFVDTSVAAETTYLYGVEAYDNAGNVSGQATLSVTTPAPPGC